MDIMRSLSIEAVPQVIQDHIAAYRSHDAEAFMATLARDALVNDIQREFLGHEAIRAWADEEIFATKVTLEIEAALEHFDNIIIRFRVDGDFDKSSLPDPLILTYYFAVRDDRITQLIILHNKTAAS
jgi:hypothetical protein